MLYSAPKIARTASLNITITGNSLVAGTGGSFQSMSNQALALLNTKFSSVTMNTFGSSGQPWTGLDGTGTDGSYNSSKTNILVLWETTNSIATGNRNAAQTASDAQAFIAARLAAHPGWKVVVLSTLPRQSFGGDTVDSGNAKLVAADALIRDNLCAWGAKAFVDVRCPGSPFRFPDYSNASFAANDALWYEAAGGRIHLTDAGYSIIAGLVSRAVLNLAR